MPRRQTLFLVLPARVSGSSLGGHVVCCTRRRLLISPTLPFVCFSSRCHRNGFIRYSKDCLLWVDSVVCLTSHLRLVCCLFSAFVDICCPYCQVVYSRSFIMSVQCRCVDHLKVWGAGAATLSGLSSLFWGGCLVRTVTHTYALLSFCFIFFRFFHSFH